MKAAELKARLCIVSELEAVGLELKPRGRHHWARCPFHARGNERTPSLKVDPARGSWWCFACAEGGDVLDFLQKFQGTTLADVMRQLGAPERPAPEHRVTAIPEHRDEKAEPLELEHLQKWQSQLSRGVEYLNGRGISLATAQEAGLGFSDGDWPGRRLAGSPVLVFPLTDASGTTVSLAARALGPQEPRWDFLPGRPKAPFLGRNLGASGELWIVEGGFDALSLMAAGVSNVVAMMGSSWRELPWNFRSLVLALDADSTGIKQGRRMAQRAIFLGKRVRILENFGGFKDVSAAWQAAALSLYGDSVTDREAFDERVAVCLESGATLAEAELIALESTTI